MDTQSVTLWMRYQLALVGGFFAMSAQVFLTASRSTWFTLPHIGNAISAGLMFGHVFALMVIVAHDLPMFLRNKLSAWIIRLLSIIGGIALGTLAWWVHLSFTLYQSNIDWFTIITGGIGLAIGFVLASFIPINNRYIRTILLIVITSSTTFTPIYFSYQNYLSTFSTPTPSQALLYFQADNPEHLWLIGIPFALAIAFFGHLPTLFDSSSRANSS